MRPWRPEALVDARRGRARRLRRSIVRATRTHFRGLGVMPPAHLLVVVQRTVTDGERPLASLLQVFEDGGGVRRHVLFLALAVGEESVTDGAVVATLRQQLHEVVGERLGTLVASVPSGPQRRTSASVVPLHPIASAAPFEEAPPPDDNWSPVDDGAYGVAAQR